GRAAGARPPRAARPRAKEEPQPHLQRHRRGLRGPVVRHRQHGGGIVSKVRRIDWSPDEYIAGTFGRLTFEEHGFYIVALNMIYSSGAHIPVEITRLAQAGGCRPQTAQRLMDQLIAKGKLTLTADGRLANGRA